MRKVTALSLTCLLALAGCEANEEPQAATEAVQAQGAEAAPAAGEAPMAQEDHAEHAARAARGPQGTELPDGSRLFGEALTADREVTELAAIAGDPARYAGQVVKTTGEVAQVCQRMGCWMELRAEGVEPVRVPMAGHAFFLPRDSAGSRATIEGTVALRELSADERQHLESEGATATTHALHISATGVVLTGT